MLEELGIKTDVDITPMTSLKIGCITKYFVEVVSISQLKRILKWCASENIKYYILGNGTNVLVGNDYYNGLIIKFGDKFSKCVINGEKVIAYSGINMFKLNKIAYENSLSGLEFSYGIPASLGGMIISNAGAFGGQISDVVDYVEVLQNGKVKKYYNKDCEFGYRKSRFEYDCIVLKIALKLKKSTKEEIMQKMNENLSKRKNSQPYNAKSCGSIFKRKENVIVSKWIDEKGLKGLSCNDAEISPIHAGFIVNNGKATCQDFIYLIKYIRNLFFQEFNENLELEIKLFNVNEQIGENK